MNCEFVGALPDAPQRSGVRFIPDQSRSWAMPYRVFGINGISPTIVSGEVLGRYWIFYEE